MFIIGFSVVNLRHIQKEAAGPGPGRTWAGPGPGPPPLFGLFVFTPVSCYLIGAYLMDSSMLKKEVLQAK